MSDRARPAGSTPSLLDAIDRRTFLGALPLTALAVGCSAPGDDGPDGEAGAGTEAGTEAGGVAPASPGGDGATAGALLPAFGVQLYTLRDAIAEDLDAVLAAVAEAGYEEVELFQLHGLTPAAMKAKLDAAGLRAASSHYDLALLEDDLERHVDGALELGQDLMIVAWLDEAYRTPDGVARAADSFDRFGAAARAAGMRFGYHNHDFEFTTIVDGATMMDALLDRTDPDLVDWQMDIFWAVNGGMDPMALLEAYAGRISSVHVKDRTAAGEMVDVGDGVIDFASLLAAARAQGLRHAFVEHDDPADALQSVRKAHDHLRSIGVMG